MAYNRSVPSDTIIAHIIYDDVALAVDWLRRTFGFTENFRYGPPDAPQGAQMHLGNAWIMLTGTRPGRATPKQIGARTQYVTVFVSDVDVHYVRSKSAGALIVEELNETLYGERQYVAEDIAGHHWLFSMHIRDVDPAEWATTANST